METNPEETTVHANPIVENPVKDDCVKDDCVKDDQDAVTSSLDRVKGWWGSYQQFVAGAVFGVSAILLGSFLRARRN